jgi:DNA-binding transcriptional ArsR family regulator
VSGAMNTAIQSSNLSSPRGTLPDQVGVLAGTEPLAAVLSPLRRRLLQGLSTPDSATGLARRFGIPRQKINYHLRKLENAGLVELVEEKNRRGFVERVVRLTARAFVISPAFLEGLAADPDLVGDQYSSAYLVAAAAKTVSDVADIRQKAERAGKRLATFALETEIAFDSPTAFNAFSSDLASEILRLTAKYTRPDSPGHRKFRLFIGAHQAPNGKKMEIESPKAQTSAHRRTKRGKQ